MNHHPVDLIRTRVTRILILRTKSVNKSIFNVMSQWNVFSIFSSSRNVKRVKFRFFLHLTQNHFPLIFVWDSLKCFFLRG